MIDVMAIPGHRPEEVRRIWTVTFVDGLFLFNKQEKAPF